MQANAGPLLTIAIPTYNRAIFLDTCLSALCSQSADCPGEVEILVSDNSSPDNTAQIVEKHVAAGAAIRYVRNERNIGPDDNFIQCYEMAAGKYVLLLGDDDIFLPGALACLLKVLRGGDYGVVHLSSYPFTADYRAECPGPSPDSVTVYNDAGKFLGAAGQFCTFISSNVINKRLDPGGPPFLEELRKTNLIQLSWTFGAMLSAKNNALVHKYCVAGLLGNSGGYKLAEVFGTNLNNVFGIFIKAGAEPRVFEPLKRKMLRTFYPANIARRRSQFPLSDEEYYIPLRRLYGGYSSFWLVTVPAIILPRTVAFALYKMAEKLRSWLRGVRGWLAAKQHNHDKI